MNIALACVTLKKSTLHTTERSDCHVFPVKDFDAEQYALVQSTLDPLNHLRAGDEPLFHFSVTFRAVHGRIVITACRITLSAFIRPLRNRPCTSSRQLS